MIYVFPIQHKQFGLELTCIIKMKINFVIPDPDNRSENWNFSEWRSNINLKFSFLFSGKVEPHSSFNMGYLVAPYSYTNGAAGGLPVSMVSKWYLYSFPDRFG